MKRIIDKDGTEYGIMFIEQSWSNDIAYIDLYKFVYEYKRSCKVFLKYHTLKGKKIEVPKRIHTYKIPIFSQKPLQDYSLENIKNFINDTIEDYKSANENRNDFNSWDGFLGDNENIKKQIMRDKKIKKLLGGDTSELENFLNSD